MYTMTRRAVSEPERRAIADLARQGLSTRQIGQRTGRAYSTVAKVLRLAAADQPHHLTESAAVSLPDGSRAELRVNRPVWLAELLPYCDTKEHRDAARENKGGRPIISGLQPWGLLALHLEGEGLTCREIASMIGKDYSYVSRIIKRTRATLAALYEGGGVENSEAFENGTGE